MIRHCVMFRWAEGTSDGLKAEVAGELDDLATMDCVADYHHGPDAGLSEGNFDYAVVGEFESAEDYRTYATDEGHLEFIARLIRPNITARAAVQYEV